jgi:hypothetical protein
MIAIKSLFTKLAGNDVFWRVIAPFTRLASFLITARNAKLEKEALAKEDAYYNNIFIEILEARKVLHGPFKGLRYPLMESVGSALYPKLIGSYEKELHGAIEEICSTNYREVINIGCGEGYYAVGLALRIPTATVFAFDIDAQARALCLKMSKINNVENRMIIHSQCTSDFLVNFKFSNKGLIVCDCEGYEKFLFNELSVGNLRNCDLLIETHDFIDISISTYLHAVFSQTHYITSIKSIDDIEKVKTYHFPEAEKFELPVRKKLFAEGRPAIMEWLLLVPKSNVHGRSH